MHSSVVEPLILIVAHQIDRNNPWKKKYGSYVSCNFLKIRPVALTDYWSIAHEALEGEGSY